MDSFETNGVIQNTALFTSGMPPVLQDLGWVDTTDGTAVRKPVPDSPMSHQSGGIVGGEGASAGGEAPATHGQNLNGSEAMISRRRRPRKYNPDSGTPMRSPPTGALPPRRKKFLQSRSTKKARDRSRGGSKKHRVEKDSGLAGARFTPYSIVVGAGENVLSKIMSFCQRSPEAICILSGNGTISSVTLHLPARPGGTATFEDNFEIVSLSGSFVPSDVGDHGAWTGGLCVTLSGPDGQLLGGGVSGGLIAASPVPITMVSFMPDVPRA